MKKSIITLISLLLFAIPAFAGEYRNDASLKDVSNPKVVFDVASSGKRLVAQLFVINKTYKQLVDFGHKPEFAIAFRAKASRFVTIDDKYVENDQKDNKEKVKSWIKSFKEAGFTLEQCKIATDFQKVDPKDILPEINVVANGFISLIGYQSKGYALVPIY